MRRRELVLFAISVVIGLAACSGPVSVTPEGYRLADSTSKTVTLLVPGGPGDEIAEATATEQTAEQVVVRVRLRHNDGAWRPFWSPWRPSSPSRNPSVNEPLSVRAAS